MLEAPRAGSSVRRGPRDRRAGRLAPHRAGRPLRRRRRRRRLTSTTRFADGAAATLVPDDAFAALAALGRAVRDRSSARVVGITGSTGKTSTKDILAALCAPLARTIAAEASFNNELGVPLTLCRLEPDTEVCILELAMRGFGQIAALAAIARPDDRRDHERRPGAPRARRLARRRRAGEGRARRRAAAGRRRRSCPSDFPVARDGHRRRAQSASPTHASNGRTRAFDGVTSASASAPATRRRTPLAALHAVDALGLTRRGKPSTSTSPLARRGDRAARRRPAHQRRYNANPISMRAALDDLVDRAGRRRPVAVLGDMAELGQDWPAYHREIGEAAAELGVGRAAWPSASSRAGT